ncbi:cytoChrome c oxidase Caa3 assembly factor [Aeromicrobium marinum DSM 15272]|uniref:CytoChrome c oxidase Caa3 assembly factor n=1 Tax=Aeromicrobium marinum DSM 15272 TaxID=585531 RepID=E2S9Q2_9ACTN|nr:cytochrome c oxidase assembly protein [Aeromicrobium marinum]EFQ83976.1 cytoChrome c oxidase Caa3 assembly factor [Aeromicrobium marinum DSM 15272]
MTATRVRLTTAGLLLGLGAMVVVLSVGGGSPQDAPQGIPDAGSVVGWGVPLLTILTQATAVATIGFLLAAVFLLPGGRNVVEGLAVDAVGLARRAAGVWAVASFVLLVLTAAEVFARPLSGLSWPVITGFAADPTGRGIWLQGIGALVLAVALRWTIGVRTLALLLGLAFATTAPVAFTGHSASSGSHTLATTSMFLHIVGIAAWVGGLAALAWVNARGSKRTGPAVARYSVLAAWAFAAVGLSGVVNASTRFRTLEEVLTSTYGALVIVKILLFTALGVFGWLHRRRLQRSGAGFARLATGELLLMATTIGVSIGLARTAPPVGAILQTPAEELLGGPMPPAPSVGQFLTSVNGNGVGIAIVVLGVALYVRGVMVLRRRGDGWPVGRSVAWGLGMLVIAWATFGGLGTYSHVFFSAHMVSHMLLSMVAPIFLVLAAPMTLALRTLPGPRQPGEVSPRSMLVGFLHSRWSRAVTHPLVPPVLFIGSLYGLYFTPAFGWLMSNHLGHAAMELHFLGVGTLFYYVLVGVDPSPRALAPFVRFALLIVTVPFHAFFSIAIMSASTVLAASYWQTIDRPYSTDLLDDQYLGGSVSWALGEVPLLLVLIALFVQWIRSDVRDARRLDRAADRDDDAALEAYNAHLRDLAAHGRRRDP